MTRDEIMRMARAAGFITGTRDYADGLGGIQFVQSVAIGGSFLPELEQFAQQVAAAEREAIIKLLDGIDGDECSHPKGWWQTSAGAEFGARIIARIRNRGNPQ